MREGFVGVHIGAGQHAEHRTKVYLAICARACQVGVEVLKSGGSALDAACASTMVLEDDGETNAGYGSNLTESGTVEMDAGIMDGSSLLFGAVGAMPGIKNPVLVAKMLVWEQQKGLLPLGRVPPGFLVGEGARDWAVRHGIPSVQTASLISQKADKLYRHYKKKLDDFSQSLKKKHPKRSAPDGNYNCRKLARADDGQTSTDAAEGARPARRPSRTIDDRVTDTVGVVVMDRTGNVASTVSSGGIALKQPGRVGQASCYGCGCWAQRASKVTANGRFTVGISTTGCGEHLVRTFLARECAAELKKSTDPMNSLKKVMKEKFIESEFLRGVPEKLGGAICMYYDEAVGRGEFLWTHTTSSMGIGFQTTSQETATTKMSRLGDYMNGSNANVALILVESVPFSTLASENGGEEIAASTVQPSAAEMEPSKQNTDDLRLATVETAKA